MKSLIAAGAILTTLFGASPTQSADLMTGMDAARRGDFATALKEWKPLAKAGDPDAQYNLGVMYLKGLGVQRDPQAAADLFERAANQGAATARFALGSMFASGHGVAQDGKVAAKWFGLAAEQGHDEAAYRLGLLHLYGHGVDEDGVTAIKWIEHAGNAGNLVALTHLGMLFHMGERVPNDDLVAAQWYRKAADTGFAPAQDLLAGMYERGLGVAESYEKAIEWAERAAEQGYFKAQSHVGKLYYEGNGLSVPGDEVRGLMWTNITVVTGERLVEAIEAGRQEEPVPYQFMEPVPLFGMDIFSSASHLQFLKKSREDMVNTMSVDQIDEARKRADAWLASRGK